MTSVKSAGKLLVGDRLLYYSGHDEVSVLAVRPITRKTVRVLLVPKRGGRGCWWEFFGKYERFPVKSLDTSRRYDYSEVQT